MRFRTAYQVITMTLVDFLSAAADAMQDLEPEPMEPYTGTAYALAEAQQHGEECAG